MKVVLTMILPMLFGLGCKKDSQNLYLQQEDVSLVQPRIEVSSTIIDSFVTISAHPGIEGTEIYYTINESEPNATSLKYVDPIKVFESGTYRFKSFHSLWKPSETISITFFKKGIQPTDIIWETAPNKKYKGNGPLTLINQKKGSIAYSDPEWVGFDTTAVADVIFKEKTLIKSIDLGYLNDPQSWILPPSEIIIYPNDSINESDKIIVEVNALDGMVPKAINNIYIELNQAVNTLRIEVVNLKHIPEWHEGAGTKAWLFMDEWIFNK